jgi:exodeoxyribonuclease VII large subunit
LPEFPKRIGVATSPFGSVWHDIQSIIQRRFPLVELALAPTPVQGDAAAAGIVDAIEAMNREEDLDVVILARGGGSLEELWPFNEEVVARAIYSSRAPVVSAVGHETDFTIADMVADRRAPTPSAAAELVVPDSAELEERILFQRRGLFQQVSGTLAAWSQDLDQAVWRIQRNTPDILSWRQRVDDLSHAYGRALESYLAMRGERTKSLESRLASLSPDSVLARGYAVVQRQDDSELVTSVSQVAPGDDIRVNVKDGSFPARALSSNPNP